MKHIAILKSKTKAGVGIGGLEKYTARIASAFADREARVSILTTDFSQNQNRMNISFYSCKTVSWPSFLRMEQFDRFTREWLNENRVDLIFGMDRNRMQTHIRAGNGVHAAYLDSRILTEGKFKRLICVLNPLHRKILQIEKESFENPRLKKLFTNSYMVRDQILARFSTHPDKIQVIHNGVEWQEMETDFNNWESGRKSALAKWGLDPSHFHLLFIGNGYLRKGLDPLLESLSSLKRTDFHLSIIGKDKRIDYYRAKTDRLGLSGQVRFFGPQAEIRSFYQFADALAIPSYYDPFANVTVEALAMGLFVLSSKQNGGHEILSPLNGAVIEDLSDPDSFTQALSVALNKPKSRLSAQQIRCSVKHLDFSRQLKTLIDACGIDE